MKTNCIYFVEGKCEAALLAALKERPQKIMSGRVKIFNVIGNLIPRSQLVTIQAGTTVVFVFDTDVPITESLKKNIQLVSTYCSKTKLVFLPQVMNLEDELVRCTDIRSITELTRSKSTKDFKRDFCAMTNCRSALDRHQLDVLRLWTQNPPEVFRFIPSNSNTIKL